MIPYGKQQISDDDIQAVVDVLRSDYLTQGPMVPRFEKALCDYTGASHAVAVNSATSALHIACRALNLGPGDQVWTTPISFVASANCAMYCGASVDFIDINPNTFNLCADKLEQKLIAAEKTGNPPKIVIPVHLCGQPCDMQAIARLSQRYGFKIIEDASHALGASYNGNKVGSGTTADITVFSFHPVKMITCGEGGAALTNTTELANKMRSLRSHGITRDPQEMTEPPHGGWYYQQLELGYNYRLSDIHAALGISQLAKLDRFVAERRQLANHYQSLLADMPLHLQTCNTNESSFHLFTLRVKNNTHTQLRNHIYNKLRGKGIAAQIHYIPIHTQPYYQKLVQQRCVLPEAESYYRETITLPLYVGLELSVQQRVCESIESVFKACNKPQVETKALPEEGCKALKLGGHR